MKIEHYAGDIFEIYDEEYILAMVESNPEGTWVKYTLINTTNGNRWCEPLQLEIPENSGVVGLTTKEFNLMINDPTGEEPWVKVRFGPYNPRRLN